MSRSGTVRTAALSRRGFMALPGLPAIAERASAELRRALAKPIVSAKLATRAVESICGRLGETAEWLTTESRNHAAVVEDVQIAFV